MGFRISSLFTAVSMAAAVTLGAGCQANPAARVPSAGELKGTWAQTGTGYEQGRPVSWENQTLVVEEAEGQGFTGYKTYQREGEPAQKEVLNGVIAPNGDILITDEDGVFRGRFLDDTIQGQYAEVGADSAAINVQLTRK
ncbi:hypothetical protein [Synechococcus sp. CCY 9618]|uniref:hypothetical protein n=1 Tax=Synechococcus sp. CCY 9618 TaxID=2815602 RepID=UPI001C241EBB|nr:hypothetical protein [Synechococcus sp. CCY 9618]